MEGLGVFVQTDRLLRVLLLTRVLHVHAVICGVLCSSAMITYQKVRLLLLRRSFD